MATKKKILGRANPIPTPMGLGPVCTIPPVASGTIALGNTLSVTTGTWTNNPGTFVYQWQRNGSDILGAVYPSYVVVNADLAATIRCVVTAWNTNGVGFAYSNSLTVAGGGGSLAGFSLGANLPSVYTSSMFTPWNNMIVAQPWTYTSGGTDFTLPNTSFDSTGWPKNMNGGTSITLTMQIPPTVAPITLTWTGNMQSGVIKDGIVGTVKTLSAGELSARTASWTPSASQASGAAASHWLTYTISATDITNATYPKNIDLRFTGAVGKLQGKFVSDAAKYFPSGMPLRQVKRTTVEINSDPIGSLPWAGLHFPNAATEPGTQLNHPIYTSTVRNPQGGGRLGGELLIPDLDGTPFEDLIDDALTLGCDPWITLPWNADNTYYDAFFSYINSYPGGWPSGRKVYVEISNEVWNSAYRVWYQAGNEATINGITRDQRYAQKAGAVFARASAVLGSNLSRIVRVLSHQNNSGALPTPDTSVWAVMDAQIGHGNWDMGATAPYYEAAEQTTLSAQKAQCLIGIDNVLAFAAAHKNAVQALGKNYGCYEAGPSLFLSNRTFAASWHQSTEFHDCEAYFYDSIARKLGNIPVCNFMYTMDYRASSTYDWGFLTYQGETESSTTPRALAIHERHLGQKTLINLSYSPGTLFNTDAPGTTAGTPTYTTTGSTFSFSSNPGSSFAIDSNTGVITNTGILSNGSYPLTVVETNPSALNSPKSTNVTITVSSPVISWATTTGVNKHANIIVNGTGNLTANLPSDGGWEFVRANVGKTGKRHVEWVATGKAAYGVGNTTDFSNLNAKVGLVDSNGVTLNIQNSTTAEIWANGSAVQTGISLPGGAYPTTVVCEFDTTGNTVKFFNQAGTQIGSTVSSALPAGNIYPHVGCGFTDIAAGAVVLNAGASAFAMTPTATYSAYNV